MPERRHLCFAKLQPRRAGWYWIPSLNPDDARHHLQLEPRRVVPADMNEIPDLAEDSRASSRRAYDGGALCLAGKSVLFDGFDAFSTICWSLG